jgi:hypothetical protein
MELSSHERDDPSRGFFHDLHSFKDFVVLVLSCAPDLFPHEDWRPADDQLNLERAFVALGHGLDLVDKELVDCEIVSRCRGLVEQSLVAYRSGDPAAGQQMLEEVDLILRKIPSH